MTRYERTDYRDKAFSRHRRSYGLAFAADFDFAMVEYIDARMVAVVDYKHCFSETRPKDLIHPNFKALANMCVFPPPGQQPNLIPAWVAWYWPEIWAYRVAPLNPPATELFGLKPPAKDEPWSPLRAVPQTVDLSEREYVAALFRVRGVDPAVQMRSTIKVELQSVRATPGWPTTPEDWPFAMDGFPHGQDHQKPQPRLRFGRYVKIWHGSAHGRAPEA